MRGMEFHYLWKMVQLLGAKCKYPYQEFGFVPGDLRFISNFATDSGFVANKSLKNGLVTTQKRNIQFLNGMVAEAQVLTNNKRLSERFFEQINTLFSR